jgi:ribonuclease HI
MDRSADRLVIWQQNVNKSPTCQHTLLSNNILAKHNIGIVMLQEPVVNCFNNTIASKDWFTVYPTTHCAHPGKTRTLTLIRSTFSTDTWEQIDFPSGDVTITALKGEWGKLVIFNIYNDGEHNETISQLKNFHRSRPDVVGHEEAGTTHILWAGDFNRHHPHWDNPNDTRLFTPDALRAAEVLIEAVASLGLELALPSGILTHVHNVTKKWTRLDQVFISEHSTNLVETCDTETRFRSIKTDHLPVITTLNLNIQIEQPTATRNFREVDWAEFTDNLAKRLTNLDSPNQITSQDRLNVSCEALTKTIQATIEDCVPLTEICSKSKRWWTKELTQMRRNMNKIGRKTCKLKDNLTHPVHEEHAEATRLYDRTLERTKKQHWRDWLERAVDPDIWAVHKYISAPATDGAKARIPVLKHKVGNTETTAGTNTEKSKALAKSFFPTKPADAGFPTDFMYPEECTNPCQITKEQIAHHIQKLKPYKAPGPDGIPNIVLMRSSDLLVDRLYIIYKAMAERNLHYSPWKTFTTIVLRKPGKPRYDVPKAYRPIALLNTMWKVLAAVVADQLSYLTEKYQLIPSHHFGGRPGRTTTDAVQLVTHKIKNAWRQGNVVSILFLDVEGAFPNAVPARLVHNLRKRCVPRRHTDFVAGMLEGRTTYLKFDDHTSEAITIDNGIGQGDPLSMVLYQYYNADILDIPNRAQESAIAYVDDALILATAKDFNATHQMLTDMMTREDGVYDWSKTHNSPLEHSKLALIDFAHRNKKRDRPNLVLPGITIPPTESTKYLGLMIDQHLNWKAQHAYAIEKGSKWAAQIRRIARPSWGITPKYARRLYIGVALPRILYGAEIWCGPPASEHAGPKSTGASKVIRQLTSIQRSGALAITGALRTSPTDTIDACAFLLPAIKMIEKWCHRSAIRLATTPLEHPLHKPVNASKGRYISRHRSPLHDLFAQTNFDPKRMEKIPVKPRDPELIGKLPFTVSIALSKEASILEDRHANEAIKVYSDGSEYKGKVGAAAILMRPNGQHRILHFHLGPDNEHTVHEAELIGILLAQHLIRTERRKNKAFAIGADNQAALEAFHSNLRKPAHNAAREILRQGIMLQKQTRGKKYALTLRWTAGHVGIPGNEIADKEARKAAEGLSSDKPLLPVYLKRPLTINPSAASKSRNTKINQNWKRVWRDSKRGKAVTKIDKNTPSAHFLRSISKADIPRRSASLVTQLLIGHIPLNEYLKRINKTDSANCPACGAGHETVRHFLLECPGYAHERWALEKSLKKRHKDLTLDNLLGDAEATIPLTNFISASLRFSSDV